jgi:hypothetical protein
MTPAEKIAKLARYVAAEKALKDMMAFDGREATNVLLRALGLL